MTSISTSGSSIIFTFEGSPYYLNNGSIECPKNSLALIVDSSEMATFKKAGADDIFLSIKYDDLDMTKEELIEYYQENMTGGGGSEEEIQELSGKVNTISGTVTSHTSNNDVHVTTQDKSYWDGKASTSDIEAAVSGKADSSAVTEEISAAVSGKADTSAVTEDISAAVSGKADSSAVTEDIEAAVSGKADSSAVTDEISAAVSGKADTSALTSHTADTTVHVTSQDKTNWNEAVTASTANTTALGGVKLVKITQSAYDQLQTKDPDTLYIITAS